MKKIIYIAGLSMFPMVAFAALENVQDIVDGLADIVDALVPIVFVLAFVYFFYGVAKYVTSAGDEEAQKSARGIMMYGVIGIFVIASIWGIVFFLQTALGVGGGAVGNIPDFQ